MAIEKTSSRDNNSGNLADLLERVLDKGIVIAGDIKISLGEVELLAIQIRLVICSVDRAREMGMEWWVNNPSFSAMPAREAIEAPLERIEARLDKLEASLNSVQAQA